MTINGLIEKIIQKKMERIKYQDIANDINMCSVRLSQIINRKVKPTLVELINFAIYFNCKIDDLIEYKEERKKMRKR